MKKTIALALLSIFASSLYAEKKYGVALTNDLLLASFQKQDDSTHQGLPDLIGVRVQRYFDGISLFVSYNRTLEPTRFSYTVMAETIDSVHYFAPTRFDMEFYTEYSSVNVGMSIQEKIGGLLFNGDLSLGKGFFSARFTKGLEAVNTTDGTILYTGDNMVSDFKIGVTKVWGDLSVNLGAGYLFATCGDGGMKAANDYDIVTSWAGPEIPKGSSLQGDLDYSGFELGLNIAILF